MAEFSTGFPQSSFCGFLTFQVGIILPVGLMKLLAGKTLDKARKYDIYGDPKPMEQIWLPWYERHYWEECRARTLSRRYEQDSNRRVYARRVEGKRNAELTPIQDLLFPILRSTH